MNQQQWHSSDIADELLAAIIDPMDSVMGAGTLLTHRKARLMICAAARSLWNDMPEECRGVLPVAELFADGLTTDAERARCREIAHDAQYRIWALHRDRRDAYTSNPRWKAALLVMWAHNRAQETPFHETMRAAPASTDVFRELFNPWHDYQWGDGTLFGPLYMVDTPTGDRRHCRDEITWLSPDVRSLAQQAYGGVAPFDPTYLLPLHDALLEAGCTDLAILNHLRGLVPCRFTGRGCTQPAYNCPACKGTGWCKTTATHVRGCWLLDLLLNKE